MTLPHLTWICPTWNRPNCLEKLVVQFLAQDYPAERRELIILDDAGQYGNQSGDGWQLLSIPRRFHSLPEKYNALLGLVGRHSDAVVIAEDDDRYSPQHSAACAAGLHDAEVSKPSVVLMTYKGQTTPRVARGRFHASIAIRTEFLRGLGGWPNTRASNFDRRLLTMLAEKGRVGDPIRAGFAPTYDYVWDGVRGHGSAFRRFGDDWYDQAAKASGSIRSVGKLVL